MAERKNYDTWYAEVRKEPFRFTWAGQDWELPHATEIDLRVTTLLEKGELDADGVFKVIEMALGGGDQAKRWNDVAKPGPVLMEILKDWLDQSGTSVGESPASTSSSPSTGRPSKRTSRATTKSGSRTRSTAHPKSA